MNEIVDKKPNYLVLISFVLMVVAFMWLIDSHVKRITEVETIDINGGFNFNSKEGHTLRLSWSGSSLGKVNQDQNIMRATDMINMGISKHIIDTLCNITISEFTNIPINRLVAEASKYQSGSIDLIYVPIIDSLLRVFKQTDVIINNQNTVLTEQLLCDAGLITEYDKRNYTTLSDINISEFKISIPSSVFREIKRQADKKIAMSKKKKEVDSLVSKLDDIVNNKKLSNTEKQKLVDYTIEMHKLSVLLTMEMPKVIIL